VAPTELYQEGVDRSDLNPATAARVANLGSFYVILTFRLEERKSGQPFK
jgi:hypothetical protein